MRKGRSENFIGRRSSPKPPLPLSPQSPYLSNLVGSSLRHQEYSGRPVRVRCLLHLGTTTAWRRSRRCVSHDPCRRLVLGVPGSTSEREFSVLRSSRTRLKKSRKSRDEFTVKEFLHQDNVGGECLIHPDGTMRRSDKRPRETKTDRT